MIPLPQHREPAHRHLPFAAHLRGRSNPADLLRANAYPGSIWFPLVFFGLWKSRFRERWLGLAIFGRLAGVDAPGVADLLAALPLFDIAINHQLIFVALFALAMLGALGVEHGSGARVEGIWRSLMRSTRSWSRRSWQPCGRG